MIQKEEILMENKAVLIKENIMNSLTKKVKTDNFTLSIIEEEINNMIISIIHEPMRFIRETTNKNEIEFVNKVFGIIQVNDK